MSRRGGRSLHRLQLWLGGADLLRPLHAAPDATQEQQARAPRPAAPPAPEIRPRGARRRPGSLCRWVESLALPDARARHPRPGAALIFSASFRVQRKIPEGTPSGQVFGCSFLEGSAFRLFTGFPGHFANSENNVKKQVPNQIWDLFLWLGSRLGLRELGKCN